MRACEHVHTCAHVLIRAAVTQTRAEGVEGPQCQKLQVHLSGWAALEQQICKITICEV